MKSTPHISFVTEQVIETIGKNIQTARLRRGESMDVAAERAGVSRQTWMRLEAGSQSVSVGLVIEALQLYGFVEQLFELGDPGVDVQGAAMDAARRPTRGKKS